MRVHATSAMRLCAHSGLKAEGCRFFCEPVRWEAPLAITAAPVREWIPQQDGESDDAYASRARGMAVGLGLHKGSRQLAVRRPRTEGDVEVIVSKPRVWKITGVP